MKDIKQHLTALIILFLLTAMAIPVEVWAQLTDTSGAEEGLRGAPRTYKYDARTSALGDATVADPTYLSGYNMNPAILSFVRDANVVQVNSYHAWNNNLMQQVITLPAIRQDVHSVSAQFGVIHNGINSLNYLGGSEVPEPEIDGIHLDLAYAYSYENVLSLGVMNNISYMQNNQSDLWSYSMNLGVLYAPSESVSYGMVFRGLGRSPVYEITEQDDGTIGPGEAGQTVVRDQNLRESLELGATLRLPVDSDYTDFSMSLANEKRFGQSGLWYKIGVELNVHSAVYFRGGLLFQPNDDIYTPRLGLGIDGDFVKIDYSVSFQDQLFERFHQLGLTIHFDRL